MKKIALVLAFFCSFAAFAQDDDILTVNAPGKSRIRVSENSIVFNAGYNIPMLLNSELRENKFWNKKIGTGIDFNVDFRKQFMKRVIEDEEVITEPTLFSVGIGLGISYMTKSMGFSNYADTLHDFLDKDNDNCLVTLNYHNVKESASLIYLDIPLYLEIGRLNRIKPSGFFKIGLKPSVLISKKIVGEGKYTSEGYYSQWNVMLDGIDHLEYYTDKECYLNAKNKNKDEYKLSPFVLWGTISGGVNFPFSSPETNRLAKWILRISVKIDYSLTPVSKSLSDSYYFKDAKFRLNQSNMMGGKGSRIFSPGVTISLIYCL